MAVTASYFFQRFYTAASAVDQDPQFMMLTCVFVAAKVEEDLITADHMATQLQLQDMAPVVRNETALLQVKGLAGTSLAYGILNFGSNY